MSGILLAVEPRPESGKTQLRELRAQGYVPGVVYGHGGDAVAIKITHGELKKHLRDIGKSKLVQLKSKDKGADKATVLIREVQRNAISDHLLHVDFQKVTLDQVVELAVPLHYIGVSKGERAGGAKNVRRYMLELACRADSIPDQIDVNIEALKIGDLLRAGDLTLPDGVFLKTIETVTLVAIEKRRKPPGADEAEGALDGDTEGDGESSEEGAEGEEGTEEQAEG